MNPQHRNPTRREDTALAPYNFVALPEAVVATDYEPECQVYTDRERSTGHIVCKLTTETPLYTRAALTADEYNQRPDRGRKKRGLRDDNADFFYIDPTSKEPVIPGSSLRGMIRALVEIASHAKVTPVAETPLVYRSMDVTSHGLNYRERLVEFNGTGYNAQGRQARLYTPLMTAGYLHQRAGGHWEICPARQIGGTTFARISHKDLQRLERDLTPLDGCRNAATIYFQPDSFDFRDVRGGFLRIKKARVLRAAAKPRDGLLKGALARSGPMPTKRSEAVVYPEDTEARSIPVPDEMVEIYELQISQEQEQLLGANGVLNEGQPIFYLVENGKLSFFGHTMMMRLPYPKTPKDFIPASLRDPNQRDLAEALFGFVGERKLEPEQSDGANEQAWSGRVSFGDAYLSPGQEEWRLQSEPLIPHILGSPKPTTFQHYLTQRNPDPFRAGTTRDGQARYRKELLDYTSSPGNESVIRGHKLYGHKGQVTADDISEDPANIKSPDEDSQHTKLSPVKAGITFEFKVHFENLNDAELGALLWALALAGEEDKTYRHKIGMGKPLGMGSVHLQPELYVSNRAARYRQLFSDQEWNSAQTKEEDVSRFLKAFADFILTEMNQMERDTAINLTEIPRIQMLLSLLEWPGPARTSTRYLEIEHPDPRGRRGKINEYRDRPVLPTPLVDAPIGNLDDDRTLANRATEEARQIRRDTPQFVDEGPTEEQSALAAAVLAAIAGEDSAADETGEEATPTDEATQVTSADELQPGMRIEGRVTGVEPSRVVLDVLGEEATLEKGNVLPEIRDWVELQERFPKGKTMVVYMLRRNRRGRLQVTMKRPNR